MNLDKHTIRRVEEFLENEAQDILQNLIIKNGDSYDVFGCYCIEDCSGEFEVYKNTHHKNTFGSLKNALSWCIADKYNQLALAKNIIDLDRKKQFLINDLVFAKNSIKKVTDPARKDILKIKQIDKEQRLKSVEEQLTKCSNLAKYWQLRGFNNEIARTRRTPPNRTNRTSHKKSERFVN